MDFLSWIALAIYLSLLIFFMPLMIVIGVIIAKKIYSRIASVLLCSVFFIIFLFFAFKLWRFLLQKCNIYEILHFLNSLF